MWKSFKGWRFFNWFTDDSPRWSTVERVRLRLLLLNQEDGKTKDRKSESKGHLTFGLSVFLAHPPQSF